MAENLAATFHNVLTLRGAKVRDPLQWSKYLQQILNYMSKQRDLYKHINDQASRLFNQGYTAARAAAWRPRSSSRWASTFSWTTSPFT